MAFTFDANIVSDLHKDARGFRPKEGWWNTWNEANDQRKQEIWDSLAQESEAEFNAERAREARAIKDYEDQITLLITLGANDRKTAIRWIIDSLDTGRPDAGYICYHLGLPYFTEYEQELKGICQEMD
jgi:beta-lactamase class D